MKMNKTMLASAMVVVTSGVASSAMALTFTSDATYTVEIGGKITVPVSSNQWEWAAGAPITLPDTSLELLTNGSTTLTQNATADFPLLVGRTKASTLGNVGGGGLNPQIAFNDGTPLVGGTTGQLTPVTPVCQNSGGAGTGTITLPVIDTNGAKVAEITL